MTPGCVAQWKPTGDATREDVVGVVVSQTGVDADAIRSTGDDETATITIIAEHPIQKADPVEESRGACSRTNRRATSGS